MSRLMTKPTKCHVHPAKTQISLGIRPVWSESSLFAWRKLGYLATHWAHSEDSDQTGRMPRLICVFARRRVILLVLSWGGSYIQMFSCHKANDSSHCLALFCHIPAPKSYYSFNKFLILTDGVLTVVREVTAQWRHANVLLPRNRRPRRRLRLRLRLRPRLLSFWHRRSVRLSVCGKA